MTITVDNRDYNQLSQTEIAGAKRISQHLFGFGPTWEPPGPTVMESLDTPSRHRLAT